MATEPTSLPLHEFLGQFELWLDDQSDAHRTALARSFERVTAACQVAGAYLVVEVTLLAHLRLGAGSLAALAVPPDEGGFSRHDLTLPEAASGSATMWIDDAGSSAARLLGAVEVALAAIWAQRETIAQRRQLEALDVAIRGIASISSVDRVLQLIVDRVRELVGAQYAALGLVGPFGRIDTFITSGIGAEQRALIGSPPEGRGLLGLIIREDHSFVIDDIAHDPRRAGFPPNHPQMHSFLGVPVHSKSRSVGNLYLANKIDAPAFSSDDLQLVERFALHAGIAIENARLHEEIGRLAIVEERQRISQDLHDSIIQSLYAISLSLEDLPEVITEDPAEGAARADRAIDSIHATIRDIRNFIMGLQPELLEEADLASGMRTLAAEFRANTLIDLEEHLASDLPDLPREDEVHILSITREALSNIARHSGASRASLDLSASDGTMHLVIGDNGRGFDVTETRSNRQRGLTNLRSRADAIGGRLLLTSEPGAGTRLELAIPLEEGQ